MSKMKRAGTISGSLGKCWYLFSGLCTGSSASAALRSLNFNLCFISATSAAVLLLFCGLFLAVRRLLADKSALGLGAV
jgi:sugar phosphate permease